MFQITPLMDEIVPLDSCPKLLTWSAGSPEVFEKMLRGVQVFTGEPVRSVMELQTGGIIVETDKRKGCLPYLFGELDLLKSSKNRDF